MADVDDQLYAPDGTPFVPDTDPATAPAARFTVTPVRDLVNNGTGGGDYVNPLEFLYGSPMATADAPPQANALAQIVSSGVKDVGKFVRSMVTAPYRSVEAEMQRPLGAPLAADDRVLDPSMEAASLVMGGGMPMAAKGALGMAGGKLYSAVEHAVENAPQAKMTASQWRGWLQNQPGVKAEELDYMGLGHGTRPVTKEQMLDHARANGVHLEGVEKKGGQHIDDEEAMTAAEEQAQHEMPRNHGEEEDAWTDRISERAHELYDEALAASGQGTRYHDYQLPGGDNYRELLLTLPDKSATKYKEMTDKALRYYKEEYGYVDPAPIEQMRDKNRMMENAKTWLEDGAITQEDFNILSSTETQPGYYSSHWDEPNVLVHMRMNDRMLSPGASQPLTDAEAIARAKEWVKEGGEDWNKIEPERQIAWAEQMKKVTARKAEDPLKSLHLEEIQSDWHQQGRKQGYDIADDPTKWTAKRVGDTWAVHDSQGREIRRVGDALGNAKTAEEAIAVAHNDPSNNAKPKGIPDAPFKNTWADLALKRAISKAVDEGYDAVSWTPGAQQAERYDLSKHIDKLEYNPETGNLIGRKGDLTPLRKSGVKPEELEGLVGKEVAKRLMEKEARKNKPLDLKVKKIGERNYQLVDSSGGYPNYLPRRAFASEADALASITSKQDIHQQLGNYKELSGLDLRVGGEGMKSFYDKMLVDKANAISKKFGAKVEYQTLPGRHTIEEPGVVTIGEPRLTHGTPRPPSDYVGVYVNGELKANYLKSDKLDQNKLEKTWSQYKVHDEDGNLKQFATRKEAEDYVSSQAVRVPVLRLTTKLREAASRKGMPLFAAGLPFKFTPVDHDPFEKKDQRK